MANPKMNQTRMFDIPSVKPGVGSLITGAIMTLLLVACGPNVVRGEAPFVQATGWSLEGQTLHVDLRIRNINGVEMPVSRIEFTVMLRDTELARYSQPAETVISPNGSETVTLDMPASGPGTGLLGRLQNGETGSQPYTLEGRVQVDGKDFFKFKREGQLYNVPGRPGQFR